MTPLKQHCENWKSGCGSDQCSNARKVVLYRGKVPCDILFVGEAPGDKEDTFGVPFYGPAGQLLDRIIAMAVPARKPHKLYTPETCKHKDPDDADRCPVCAGGLGVCMVCNKGEVELSEPCSAEYRLAFTNTVGCIPRDEVGGKADAPSHEQMEFCKPRLEEFMALCKPRMIVCVGSVARDWLKPGYLHSPKLPPDVLLAHIVHPAAILKGPTANKGLAVQRDVIDLSDAIHRLENPSSQKKTPALSSGFSKRFPGLAKQAAQEAKKVPPPKPFPDFDKLSGTDWDDDRIPF